jgi:hypothetical protein
MNATRRLLRASGLAGALLAGASSAGAEPWSLELDPEALGQLRQQAEVYAAPMLRDAILKSRQEALAAGAQPMPAALRQRLRGYFRDELLDRVRWRVGGGSEVSLQLNVIQYGDRAAITLNEVVVFARQADALGDAALWAHELGHVDQFARWGVDGFAQRYVHDYRAVEAEAEQAASGYLGWLARRPGHSPAAAASGKIAPSAPALEHP